MGLLDVLVQCLSALCGNGQKEEPVQLEPQVPAHRPQHEHQQEQPQPHPPPQHHPQPHPYPHSPKPHHEHPHEESPQAPRPHDHEPPAHQPHHRSRRGVNENLENQHNPYYVDLRERANRAGDEMARYSRESQEAYHAGDGAAAKQLSETSKKFRHEMETLNLEASDWIFKENNTDSEPGEVDLHGLYVKEAITYADRAIEEARARGENTVRLIVGKGMHSKGGASKLGPAIEELMQRHQLVAALDPQNTGVLVVQVGGAPDGVEVGPDEIRRRLESGKDECVIM